MFPLKKDKISINKENSVFINDYSKQTEIPVENHPGSFGFIRKNHIHEGVDLYCNQGDFVYSMEDGEIIKIINFTGESVGSGWWNETYAVLVKHKDFYINYGEIIPNNNLSVGMMVQEGDVIGSVETVLKKNKGRPMCMLHLEMYMNTASENSIPIGGWKLNEDKPNVLINPTPYLLNYYKE